MDEVQFGRYRLLSVIGEGGMGKVYRAHDTMMDREVAIKVLPPDMATEPGYVQRFRREAQITARLNEPHIISIYEAGEIEGRLYLVMPIIEGTDVHGLLQRDGPMSPQRAVHIIEQLAAALDAAHAVGLVHRDIKPSNALVTGNDFVYLIDFGVAHVSAGTKLTSTNMIVGTLNYIAPERFTSGVSDARSDVYALACVLYECLTGAHPFPGDSIEQQMAAHIWLAPPRPTEQRPDLPIGFDEVIAVGMAKDPDARYQQAQDLATAAQHALATAPSLAPHTAPLPGPPQPSLAAGTVWHQSAHPNPGPTSQHPAGGPVPQPETADWQGSAIAPPPTPWEQARRRRLKWPLVAAVAVVLAGVGIGGYLLRPSQTPAAQPAMSSGRAAQPAPPPGRTAQPAPPPGPTSAAAEPGVPGAAITPTSLGGLLLSVDQINTAMGASGMSVVGTMTTPPDNSAPVSDPACLPLTAAVQAKVYEGSRYSAMHAEVVGKGQQEAADQAVVLFSSPQDASSFFTASTKSWGACSNRQFTLTMNGNSQVQTVSPVSNTNGTLSATITGANSAGSCDRALTVAYNVAVDIFTCGGPPGSAVNIAHQIAAKVPAT